MKASVELLSGIVRAGVNHTLFGDPFDYAVGWSSVDGRTAVLKALVAGDAEKFRPYVRAATDALKALGFEAVTWERARHMEKKIHPDNLPHLSDAKTDEERLAGAAAWTNAIASKKYTFVVAEEHAIDDVTDVLLVVRKKIA